jgi:amino acid transporter
VFTSEGGKSNWSIQDFVTAYVVIPIFLGLFGFWKFFKKTSFVRAREADIWTGKAALDAEYWPERLPRNILEKIWFWIA